MSIETIIARIQPLDQEAMASARWAGCLPAQYMN